MFNLASLSAGSGRYPEAADYYQKILVLNPDDADALSNLGDLLRLAGQPDQAEAHYLRALSAKPDRVATRISLANLCVEQQRYDEAVAAYVLALTADHGDISTRNQLARPTHRARPHRRGGRTHHDHTGGRPQPRRCAQWPWQHPRDPRRRSRTLPWQPRRAQIGPFPTKISTGGEAGSRAALALDPSDTDSLYHRALTHVGDSQAVRGEVRQAAPIDLRNDFDSVSLRARGPNPEPSSAGRYDGGSRTDVADRRRRSADHSRLGDWTMMGSRKLRFTALAEVESARSAVDGVVRLAKDPRRSPSRSTRPRVEGARLRQDLGAAAPLRGRRF